jgi:hypothetical protein
MCARLAMHARQGVRSAYAAHSVQCVCMYARMDVCTYVCMCARFYGVEGVPCVSLAHTHTHTHTRALPSLLLLLRLQECD